MACIHPSPPSIQATAPLLYIDSNSRSAPLPPGEAGDNQLVQVRLGLASSLFTALRSRHAPTADHSLRVAALCSSWSWTLGLTHEERDALEMAALLHDVGKVGVPDTVLLKPKRLENDEVALMNRHWQIGLEILAACCTNEEVMDILRYARAWYNGGNEDCPLAGNSIPLGARMLAIADAYDAMTSDHVYRPAVSHERALDELMRYAGTQFDPELVAAFAEQQHWDHAELRSRLARRWLADLDPEIVNANWKFNARPVVVGGESLVELCERKLLEHMHDGVVFVDAGRHIVFWNRGAERLTGTRAEAVLHRRWLPELLHMEDERGSLLDERCCPVAHAIRTGTQSLRRLTLQCRGRHGTSVDMHIVPVLSRDGTNLGAAILLHDVSSQITLEERCQNLHELATKDPLTQAANRAEFERVHELFVELHRQTEHPCSLIICDVDHFKSINDTFGHQAGDEVLQSVARLLRSNCRPGDLVARYGGEEFVILCSDCDVTTAAMRAEEFRRSIAAQAHSALGGRSLTISFGVTEIQPGDTPETMLRRADRALLQAKKSGRNRVVQLGVGSAPTDDEPFLGCTIATPACTSQEFLEEAQLATKGPLSMAVEKLRGFVADQHAEVVATEGNHLRLQIGTPGGGLFRRISTGPCLLVDAYLEEQHVDLPASDGLPPRRGLRTILRVTIKPRRKRDRHLAETREKARQILASLRSYLMAEEPICYEPGV